MSDTFDTLLLLALPASGKSEVRKYLRHISSDQRRTDLHLGDSVQLDDFPYVHLMRRIDHELAAAGENRLYFPGSDQPFTDPYTWGTLVHLVNEDYEDLLSQKKVAPPSAALHLFHRLDAASEKCGAKARMKNIPEKVRETVADSLEKEARELLDEKQNGYPDTLEGKTIVIEFARGGAHNSSMPLKAPYGYQYSLGQLSENILKRSTILYVWVTPEESRRKNEERGDPNDPGSILHHSVPLDVMMNEYGCDDMDWLEENADVKGTITISAHGQKFSLPIGRFDNRKDKTSFIREDSNRWDPKDVEAIHEGLRSACQHLMTLWQKTKNS